MEKQFCSYEISKGLISLGFNGECFGYFHINKNYQNGYKHCLGEDTRTNKSSIVSPLYQQSIDFLREKYNMFIVIDDYLDGDNKTIYTNKSHFIKDGHFEYIDKNSSTIKTEGGLDAIINVERILFLCLLIF